ncbi:hypothetical protein [Helicobacter sp.]
MKKWILLPQNMRIVMPQLPRWLASERGGGVVARICVLGLFGSYA